MEIDNIFFDIKKDATKQEIEYANKIADEYKKQQSKIANFILNNNDFVSFYKEYNLTEENLMEKLNIPTIKIINENQGVVVYTNHSLDKIHIISFEFMGLFEKLAYLTIDG